MTVRRTASAWTVAGPASMRAAAGTPNVFAGWRADEASGLTIENDRYGVHPFFYALASDGIHLSTSVEALLSAGVSARLDDAALAVFLRLGFFVGDDTPFTAIRAMPPSALLDWISDRPAVRSGWSPPAAASISRGDAIESFGHAFTAAVSRALTSNELPVAVLLSGGHDSRHILLAMAELEQLPARAVTVHPYPPDAADDVAIARDVAAGVGTAHVVLPQRHDRIAAEQEKNRLTHYCSDEHAQFLPLRDYFAREHCAVFDGLAGDVLSQSQRLDAALHALFVEKRVEQIAESVLGDRDQIEPALARLLTADAYHRFNRALAIGRVAEEAARYAASPNPIAAFFFYTRTRREIALAPFGILNGSRVFTPFLDQDVADLLLSLPYEIVADRRLHTDVLVRRYPRFAGLPFGGKRAGAIDRRYGRRLAGDLLRLMKTSSRLVNTNAVRLRALRAWMSGSSGHLWFVPRLVHLLDAASAGDHDLARARA